MKVVEKIESAKHIVLVLTGNGRWERRILQGLAPKYDHDVLLFFPPTRGITGLIALQALKQYAKMGISFLREITVLFLIDKEHFRTENYLNEVRGKMLTIGIRVISAKELDDGVYFIKASSGPRTFHVYIAVLGVRKI